MHENDHNLSSLLDDIKHNETRVANYLHEQLEEMDEKKAYLVFNNSSSLLDAQEKKEEGVSDLDPKDEMEVREEINPIERKLEIMSQLSKKSKMAKVLWEKSFKEMRADYAEHHHPNFEKYRKNFETLEFLVKNLITEEKKEEDESSKNKRII